MEIRPSLLMHINMAYQEIKNIKIKGIVAAVPSTIEENRSLSLFDSSEEFEKFAAITGIERRRVVEEGTCASDLCFHGAEELLENIQWDRSEIEALVFVSQTPDYKLPATSCVLQQRLGLKRECMSFDISMGCSGWVYGLTVLGALMQNGSIKKALLLVGDTVTTTKSKKDKSTYPLFGDAGSATALEYEAGALGIKSALFTDGSGFDAIMIRDGGARHPVTQESFQEKVCENGSVRNNMQSILDGTSVFTFGITKAPQSVKLLTDFFQIDKETVDYFVFHQANMMMNEKIRKKLKIESEKVPYVLADYGNTSSTSIPLTIAVELANVIKTEQLKFIACGFGVGLSWGTVYFETDGIICSLIEIGKNI